MFGASSPAPTQSAPAFVPMTTALGTSGSTSLGFITPTGFGICSTTPWPVFPASTTTPPFEAPIFPAFGASFFNFSPGSPTFGPPTPTFATTPLGSTTTFAFCTQTSAFGSQATQPSASRGYVGLGLGGAGGGSRVATYTPTPETDNGAQPTGSFEPAGGAGPSGQSSGGIRNRETPALAPSLFSSSTPWQSTALFSSGMTSNNPQTSLSSTTLSFGQSTPRGGFFSSTSSPISSTIAGGFSQPTQSIMPSVIQSTPSPASELANTSQSQAGSQATQPLGILGFVQPGGPAPPGQSSGGIDLSTTPQSTTAFSESSTRFGQMVSSDSFSFDTPPIGNSSPSSRHPSSNPLSSSFYISPSSSASSSTFANTPISCTGTSSTPASAPSLFSSSATQQSTRVFSSGMTSDNPQASLSAATPSFGQEVNRFGQRTRAFGSSSIFDAPFSTGGGFFSSNPSLVSSTNTGGFSQPTQSMPSFLRSTPSSAFDYANTSQTQAAQPFGSPPHVQPDFWGAEVGSRAATWTATTETDSGAQPHRMLDSISAMPIYKGRSHEELRWEDYRLGDRAVPAPPGQSFGVFGFVYNSCFGAIVAQFF